MVDHSMDSSSGSLIVDWPSSADSSFDNLGECGADESPCRTTASSSPVRRRNVRFADSSTFEVIQHSENYHHPALLWYSQRESVELKNDIRTVIRAMRRRAKYSNGSSGGHDPSDDHPEYCIRGLEHLRSNAAAKNQQQMKEAVIDAVLDEQDRQYNETGATCPIGLAIASRTTSRWARRVARAAAKQDQVDAMRYHLEGSTAADQEEGGIVKRAPPMGPIVEESSQEKRPQQQLHGAEDNFISLLSSATVIASNSRPSHKQDEEASALRLDFRDSLQHINFKVHSNRIPES